MDKRPFRHKKGTPSFLREFRESLEKRGRRPLLAGVLHSHSHGDELHDHNPGKESTPLVELLVMMKYLVSHNDAHAQEVADLAQELLSAGKHTAYDEIMDAVADFDMVNAKLAAILGRLSDKKF